jgi:hypothetical protein
MLQSVPGPAELLIRLVAGTMPPLWLGDNDSVGYTRREPSATPERNGAGRTSLTRFVRLAAVLGCAGVSLSACVGTGSFPPACPEVAIDRDLRDLVHYRPSRTGTADLADLVVDARIAGFTGSCAQSDKDQLTTTVAVTVELTRGPAARSRTENLPIFVAVVSHDTVLDKQVYPLQANFPPNMDRLRLTSSPIMLNLPVGKGKPGSTYQVWIGFQLTPQELALNREREGH